jgi:hypothetical protein
MTTFLVDLGDPWGFRSSSGLPIKDEEGPAMAALLARQRLAACLDAAHVRPSRDISAA